MPAHCCIFLQATFQTILFFFKAVLSNETNLAVVESSEWTKKNVGVLIMRRVILLTTLWTEFVMDRYNFMQEKDPNPRKKRLSLSYDMVSQN